MHLEMVEISGWRGGSQVDKKATERVYAEGKDAEGVDDGPDSADMKEERDVHDPGKYRGITLLKPTTETVGEGSRRKDQDKSRRSSSFLSFTQCSPICGRMPLVALSLWPCRQPYRPRLVVGVSRGGGPSSVAPRSRNAPTGRR